MFLGLFFIFCAINVPNLFFRISLDENSNLKCDSTPLINQIRNMIISLFRVILPIIFQIVFSALLIYKLFKVRSNVNRNQSMEKEYKFARIILWLNLMFIITEMPFLFITFYFSLFGIIPKFPLDANASHSLAIATLLYYVATLFALYLFGSIFFVNLFTNTLFKREIKTIFRFRKPSSVNQWFLKKQACKIFSFVFKFDFTVFLSFMSRYCLVPQLLSTWSIATLSTNLKYQLHWIMIDHVMNVEKPCSGGSRIFFWGGRNEKKP
jgi:hypothetical protein